MVKRGFKLMIIFDIWKINNHGDGSMQIIQTGGGSKATAPDGAGAQGGGGEALQITLTGGRLPLHPRLDGNNRWA